MSINEITSGYIRRKQLAKELGERLRGRPFSEFTLIRWEKDGHGPPPTRVGRDVVYNMASVERWLKALEENA
jgi:predicted DNA-binding transcriptional regulator AlpA